MNILIQSVYKMCVHSTVNIQCMGQGDVTEDKTASRASRQTPVQFPEPMEKPDAMLHTCNPTVLFWDEKWRQETRAAAQEPAQQQKWPENKWKTGTDYHLTNCSVCHTHHDMHMRAHPHAHILWEHTYVPVYTPSVSIVSRFIVPPLSCSVPLQRKSFPYSACICTMADI